MVNVIDLFTEELQLQKEKGYTVEKDHETYEGSGLELIQAGDCYIEWGKYDMEGSSGDCPPFGWPWEASEFKPRESAIENLIKGVALIAAGLNVEFHEMGVSE